MRIDASLTDLKSALKPSRISRPLVTILVLTFIQVIAGPIANFNIPSAQAFTQETISDGTTMGGTGGNINNKTPCSDGAVTGIKASSTGGSYSQAFGYTCTSFNQDGTLSSASTYTEIFHWDPATTDLNQSCTDGKVGIGIKVDVAASMVREFALICGNPMSQASPSTLTYIPNTFTGGTPTTYTCPTGKVLVGFNTKTGAGMDQMTPRCAGYTGFVYAAVGTPSITSSGVHTATVAFTGVAQANSADTPETYTVTATSSIGTIETTTGLISPITISNLRSNVSYTITVTGANTYGNSAATGSVSLPAAVLPGSDTDTALSLNGSSQYAWTETSSAIGITNGFSLEAWVKPETITSGRWNLVLCKEGVFQFGYQVVSSVAYWHYGISSSSTIYTNVNTNVPVRKDEWQHIAITRAENTNSVGFYLNGVKVFTGTADQAGTGLISSSNTNPFSIGARRDSAGTVSGWFGGQIDHVRLFNSARTSTEILDDLKTYTTSNDSGLVAYFDFNEEAGSLIFNRKVGALAGSDLKVAGSASWKKVAEESTTATSPYTVIKFPRTYLTSSGGWKVPTNVTAASLLVVAGGGGGGARAAGGGGAGGLVYRPTISLTPGSLQSVVVGQGGQGGFSSQPLTNRQGLSGQASSFGTANFAVGGGGGGGAGDAADTYRAGLNGGSGGGAAGAAAGNGSSAAYGLATQVTTYSYGLGNRGGSGMSGSWWNGGGGGGSGGAGSHASTSSWDAGNGGAGTLDPVGLSNLCLAAGGGGGTITGGNSAGGAGTCASGITTAGAGTIGAIVAASATANSGSGGGGSGYNTDDVAGGNGGSGIIIVRWITALKPSFTYPTTAYLNAGMTETFTTNVAQDSATAVLTRTFRWESSTTGVNGTYSLIKQGTGAANAAFSWVPQDTQTSGSTYAYRVVVTDSDTAGLFIVDTSTPVWAIINKALNVSGTSSISKRINLSKNETFTITLGTSTYRPSLAPVIPGITLDTSTAGIAVIKIADTVTVGTYYETLTVIDSVSASVVTPLIIKVAAPPTLLNSSEVISDNLVFSLEAGNSASLIADSGTVTTGLTWNDLSGGKANAATGAGVNTGGLSGTTCSAPTYTAVNGGALNFSANTTTCYFASGFTGKSLINNYTVEAWFKTSATLPSGAGLLGQVTPNTSAPVSVYIVNYLTSGLIVSFYDNVAGVERYANCPYVPTIGAWTHISGTYDGTTLTTYINGSSRCTATASWTPNSTTNSLGFIIGNGPSGGTSTAFPGSIASVRMYNKSLTSVQILANYNATKARFDNSNTTFVIPTKKYGATLLDSFTATSGIDTKTVTFAVGDRSGIDWETVTATNRVNLTMQSNLPVGSTYDTITVTDTLGQSTYLPITLKVTKADAITIRVETLTAVNYSTKQITTLPNVIVTGLVSTDTLTTSVLYRDPYSDPTRTCAQGGPCQTWSIGPGGGRVVGTSQVAGASGVGSGGNFIEIAPANWASPSGDFQTQWASTLEATMATDALWGAGAINNKLIRDAIGQKATAVNKVLNITINGKSDWYLPTLNELRNAAYNLAIGGYNDLDAGYYWTSSESTTAPSMAMAFNPAGNGGAGMDLLTRAATAFSKDALLYVRPIRAFSAARYESVAPPTNAATYTLLPQIETVSADIAMNYQDVIYQNSSFTINQINQRPLGVYMYGGVVGSPYFIYLQGGNGTGAVTETLTGTASLTGCAVNNHYLTAAEQKQGFCEVRVVKAGDQNYYSETQTVQMYFMAYVNNQPTGVIGSGSTIGLNGKTSLTIDDSSTVRVPRIISFSKSGSTLTINGEGFGNSPVTITFERYVNAAPNPTPTLGGTVIVVAIPGTAVSGPVLVITSGGRDSIDWLDLP